MQSTPKQRYQRISEEICRLRDKVDNMPYWDFGTCASALIEYLKKKEPIQEQINKLLIRRRNLEKLMKVGK